MLEDYVRESRAAQRFSIHLDVKYVILGAKDRQEATGRTVNISTKGILFRTARPLPVGTRIQIAIRWPVLLYNTTPMRLIIAGSVVRCDQECVAVAIQRHKFTAQREAVSEIVLGASWNHMVGTLMRRHARQKSKQRATGA